MEKYYLNKNQKNDGLFRLYSQPEMTYDDSQNNAFAEWLTETHRQQDYNILGFRRTVKSLTLDRLEGLKAHVASHEFPSRGGEKFIDNYEKLSNELFGVIIRDGVSDQKVNLKNINEHLAKIKSMIATTNEEINELKITENTAYFIKRVREQVEKNTPIATLARFINSVEIADYFPNLLQSGSITIQNHCDNLLAEAAFDQYLNEMSEKIELLEKEIAERSAGMTRVRNFEMKNFPAMEIETYTLEEKRLEVVKNPFNLNAQDELMLLNRGNDIICYTAKNGKTQLVVKDLKNFKKLKEKSIGSGRERN